jgi:hypothetical protein
MKPDESSPEIPNPTRRQWLLRLGEMVVLAGVSGLVAETAAGLLNGRQVAPDPQPGLTALPPGLYDASQDHLVHALGSAGKMWSPPPGSETDYIQPNAFPFQPLFFSPEEFRVITRFVEIVLGDVDPAALSQATQWFDLWLHSAAGVREAARHLDSMHRALAVAVYGEESVRDLESADPQSIARAGLAALRNLSQERYGHEFLQLTAPQQIDLLSSVGAQPDSPLRKFFDITHTEAIRGYYTSAAGLKELDYKGNAYYPESPGCERKS